MSLHVRLEISFWTHRKTIRLRSLIGEAALWIPPRLWSYAAENQPDGDFSDYSADELALLLGYSSNAQAMLEALQQARWLDGKKIHGWQEHNGYHATFSERAKVAARARWKGKEKTRKDKKGKEASNATSINPSGLEHCLAKFSENLRKTFLKWISFRKGLGKKPKDWDTMFSEQAVWLGQFNEKTGLEILQQSMRNGWQGLFTPKDQPKLFDTKPKTKSDQMWEETHAKRSQQ